jgi:hypothetical protein
MNKYASNPSMNGYTLTNRWFEFAQNNPEKIKPTTGILYFYIVHMFNKAQWPPKHSLYGTCAMNTIGIASYHTYRKALDDLIAFGLIELVTASRNQFTANVIALVNFDKASASAPKKQDQYTHQGIDSINKPINGQTISNECEPRESHPLLEWIRVKAPKLMAMKKPLTSEQLVSIVNEFSLDVSGTELRFKEMLKKMENRPDLTSKNECADQAIRTWWLRERGSATESNENTQAIRMQTKAYNR